VKRENRGWESEEQRNIWWLIVTVGAVIVFLIGALIVGGVVKDKLDGDERQGLYDGCATSEDFDTCIVLTDGLDSCEEISLEEDLYVECLANLFDNVDVSEG